MCKNCFKVFYSTLDVSPLLFNANMELAAKIFLIARQNFIKKITKKITIPAHHILCKVKNLFSHLILLKFFEATHNCNR